MNKKFTLEEKNIFNIIDNQKNANENNKTRKSINKKICK